ncbi:MAG: hypothetical protein HC806_04565 [Anaerolineae bacterium]|nr:hypothetical protein [Anaerolineae bacterium]
MIQRQLMWIGLALLIGATFTIPAWAQEGLLDAQAEVDYVFGKQITFRARFADELAIQKVEIIFEVDGYPAVVESATLANGIWEYSMMLRRDMFGRLRQ